MGFGQKEFTCMRIGIDGRFWHSSHAGLSQYTKGIIKALVRQDKENEYLVFLNNKDLEEWDIKAGNFRTIVINIGHFSWLEQLIFPFKLSLYKLDLVYFPNFNHPILYLGKIIITVHDLAYFYFPADRLKGKIFKWGYFLVMWLGARRALNIIVDTHLGKEELIKKLGAWENKVHVVPLGVDELRFKVDQREVSKLKQKLKLNFPIVLYVGSWRKHKNLPALLSAFEKIRRQKIPLHMILGGKPNSKILEIIDVHPYKSDIRVLGFIPENHLGNFFGLADIFIYPSLYEGFGLPILEAQSLGIPVATSKVSTLPEVGGEGAFYFDPFDPQEMAEVILRILKDKKLRQALVKKGKENLKRFGWESSARQILNLLKEGYHHENSY